MNTKILSLQQKDNLAVVQFSTIPNNSLEIVTSTYALKNNLIEVKEISEGGSVNELLVLNHSGKLVLLMDGDILDGAKQNRVLNTSVLLAPQSKTKIPVSCVESGRWDYKSSNFQPTDYVAPANLRANKSMKVSINLESLQGHQSDQREVWDNVAAYSTSLGVSSGTSNLSDVFDGSQNSYQKFLDSFTHHSGSQRSYLLCKQENTCPGCLQSHRYNAGIFPKTVERSGHGCFRDENRA
jgi:hypothetical protein